MNTLEITKEIKQVTFKYVADVYEFTGTCNVTAEKEVTNISAQVYITSSTDGIESPRASIGNVSSNGSTNVNIYDKTYKDKIDEVAHYFKLLQEDLTKKYNVLPFNEEV